MKKSVKQYIKKRVAKELNSRMEYQEGYAAANHLVDWCAKERAKILEKGLRSPTAKYLIKHLRKGTAMQTKKLGSKT